MWGCFANAGLAEDTTFSQKRSITVEQIIAVRAQGTEARLQRPTTGTRFAIPLVFEIG